MESQHPGSDPRLTFADRYIYQRVAEHGDGPISYAELASTSKSGPEAARNAINNLIATGWLEVIERQSRVDGKIRGSRYRARKPGRLGGDTTRAA